MGCILSPDRDPEQIALLAERLDAFPAQAGAPEGTLVPVPGGPDFKKKFAELMYDKGARIHLDEAVLVPVPGDQPGMGMWNFTKWVKPGEVPEATPDEPAPDVRVAVMSLLQRVNPELAEQIRTMPDDELPALRAELEAKVPNAMKQVQQINEDMAADIKAKAPAKKAPRKRAPAKKTTRKKAQ